jgi:hypothetical protein
MTARALAACAAVEWAYGVRFDRRTEEHTRTAGLAWIFALANSTPIPTA